MNNLITNLNIETVVAILFGITAITTVIMSISAYAYQRRREHQKDPTLQKTEEGTAGKFFVRVR